MAFYCLSVSNTALNTSNDTLTILSAASRRILLHEVSGSGMGTVSAANELGVFKSTVGTTPGGSVTAAPISVDMAAAAFTNATTWSAQPTLGNNYLRLGINANGGVYRWVAKPGTEIQFRNAEQLSFRSVVGTSSVSFHCMVEEI